VAGGEVEHNVVEVTNDRRRVMGVSTIVVHDLVTSGGEMVEDTFDWYAQDRNGDVWYFGEAVRNFEDGRFANTNGSWEAGVDGALPGLIMVADPIVGRAYRQEFYKGKAEDLAEIVRTGDSRRVSFGSFDEVLVTHDWSPLEPLVIEEKYYAPGVGLIYETITAGGNERSELVSYVRGT
jgi:hypothetical protein